MAQLDGVELNLVDDGRDQTASEVTWILSDAGQAILYHIISYWRGFSKQNNINLYCSSPLHSFCLIMIIALTTHLKSWTSAFSLFLWQHSLSPSLLLLSVLSYFIFLKLSNNVSYYVHNEVQHTVYLFKTFFFYLLHICTGIIRFPCIWLLISVRVKRKELPRPRYFSYSPNHFHTY